MEDVSSCEDGGRLVMSVRGWGQKPWGFSGPSDALLRNKIPTVFVPHLVISPEIAEKEREELEEQWLRSVGFAITGDHAKGACASTTDSFTLIRPLCGQKYT